APKTRLQEAADNAAAVPALRKCRRVRPCPFWFPRSVVLVFIFVFFLRELCDERIRCWIFKPTPKCNFLTYYEIGRYCRTSVEAFTRVTASGESFIFSTFPKTAPTWPRRKDPEFEHSKNVDLLKYSRSSLSP